jgi:DNA-directed RNA polymerase specialized sigma24 family protein
MKPRFAKILVLRYSGCSYDEIAAAVGIASSSVGTLLARAERNFKERYQNFSR